MITRARLVLSVSVRLATLDGIDISPALWPNLLPGSILATFLTVPIFFVFIWLPLLCAVFVPYRRRPASIFSSTVRHFSFCVLRGCPLSNSPFYSPTASNGGLFFRFAAFCMICYCVFMLLQLLHCLLLTLDLSIYVPPHMRCNGAL